MNNYIEYIIEILTKAKSKIDQEIMQLKKEKREDGKVLKPASYIPADVSKYL